MNNIYENIFEEVYGYSLEEIDETKAKTIKHNIISLRKSYRMNNPVTHYDKDGIRKAYMLCYYPNYSLPAYELMKNIIIPELQNNNKKRIKLTFFAAGPAPEAYGTLMALNDISFDLKIQVYILDFEKQWENERRATSNLLRRMDKLRISQIKHISGCNLTTECRYGCPNWINCENTVFYGDVLFMQNCINHMREEDKFYEKLKNKILYMQSGAIFTIIDLDYPNVIKVLKQLIVLCNDYVQVIATNIENSTTKSKLEVNMPNKMNKYIFTGENDLIGKKNTHYYYLILKRK